MYINILEMRESLTTMQCYVLFFFHLVYVSSSVGKTCHSYKKSFIRQFSVLSFCQILYC